MGGVGWDEIGVVFGALAIHPANVFGGHEIERQQRSFDEPATRDRVVSEHTRPILGAQVDLLKRPCNRGKRLKILPLPFPAPEYPVVSQAKNQDVDRRTS